MLVYQRVYTPQVSLFFIGTMMIDQWIFHDINWGIFRQTHITTTPENPWKSARMMSRTEVPRVQLQEGPVISWFTSHENIFPELI